MNMLLLSLFFDTRKKFPQLSVSIKKGLALVLLALVLLALVHLALERGGWS